MIKLPAATIMVFALCLVTSVYGVQTDVIWDLQAVDADGWSTHPKAGASPTEENIVVIEGTSLASTGELDQPEPVEGWAWYSIWVQADEEKGGLQAFSGIWNRDLYWSSYPDIIEGDRVRITGWAACFRGKTFINDRHSTSLMWSVEVLSHGSMPEPEVIPSVSDCNYFDQTREGGGERWQTRWTKLKGVEILAGVWGAGEELLIRDDTGSVLMKLADPGDFNSFTPPAGRFDVVGIFDQEDYELPFHDSYRIWVKRMEFITPRLEIAHGENAGTVDIFWESKEGVTYTVLGSDDMENWSPVAIGIEGDDTVITLNYPVTLTKQYYRLLQSTD